MRNSVIGLLEIDAHGQSSIKADIGYHHIVNCQTVYAVSAPFLRTRCSCNSRSLPSMSAAKCSQHHRGKLVRGVQTCGKAKSYLGPLSLSSSGIRMVLPVTNQSEKSIAAFNNSPVAKDSACPASGNLSHQTLTMPSCSGAKQDLAFSGFF